MSVPCYDRDLANGANFLTVRRRTNPPAWVIVYLAVFLLNAATFSGWLFARRSNEIYNDLAKATSALTLLNFVVICASIRYIGLRRGSVGRIFHESGSCYLFLLVLAHTIIEIVRRRGNATSYVTGTIMILVLLMGALLLRFRKYRYNRFYYAHVACFLLWSVLSVVHSVYFLPLVLLAATIVYGSRLTMRLSVPVEVTVEQISDEFVLIELKIRKSRWTRFLLIDKLTKHNGNVDIWLVCNNISYLERHPFNVIETRHRKRYAFVRVLVAKLGDWTEKLCDLLATNAPYELFSSGLSLSIDHCRLSADACCVSNLRRRNRLLFLLRNEEIVVLLRYLVFICDPRNEKCRDRFRQIFLHYSVTDLNYLVLLQEYLTIAATYKCVTVTTLVYSRETILFNGSPTIADLDNDTLKYENALKTINNRTTTTLIVPDSILRQKIKRYLRQTTARKSPTDTLRVL